MLYEVRCLKSNEDMILALAGQFKQLSHEPEKFSEPSGVIMQRALFWRNAPASFGTKEMTS